jgi:hypothetical protein
MSPPSSLPAVIALVLADLLMCGFSVLRAEKPHMIEKEGTALPKAQYANCVSPNYE